MFGFRVRGVVLERDNTPPGASGGAFAPELPKLELSSKRFYESLRKS